MPTGEPSEMPLSGGVDCRTVGEREDVAGAILVRAVSSTNGVDCEEEATLGTLKSDCNIASGEEEGNDLVTGFCVIPILVKDDVVTEGEGFR